MYVKLGSISKYMQYVFHLPSYVWHWVCLSVFLWELCWPLGLFVCCLGDLCLALGFSVCWLGELCFALGLSVCWLGELCFALALVG